MVVDIICFKADMGVHDTGNKYNLENVSFGAGAEFLLSDLFTIEFEKNEITETRIDERNLILC